MSICDDCRGEVAAAPGLGWSAGDPARDILAILNAGHAHLC